MTIFHKIKYKSLYLLTVFMSKHFGRQVIDRRNRKRLRNMTFTIISSNCNGGLISHDLGLQFRSPFVNLRIDPKDYLKLLKNLDYYLSCELHFIEEGLEADYPIAFLDDIKLYFMHYDSEVEAYQKWHERVNRINRDNMFILFTDRDGCTYEDLLEYDNLPYKNKIVFCHEPHPEVKSAVYIHGYENEEQVGVLSDYRSEVFQIRYLDEFDYVKWLNGEND